MYCYILESNISNVYSRLCLTSAFGIERVKHAARTSFIWLFLLLRAQIDRPPDGLVHSNVLVKNSIDNAISVVARIRLEIDTFERSLHNCISESNISNTVDFWVWRDSAYSESHT